MCGIVAVLSEHEEALPLLMTGLARLEYRGYDSAGFALLNGDTAKLVRLRAPGPLSELRRLTEELTSSERAARVGIGHTRWATHGAATLENAHPHSDCQGRIAVVHNGVIENADELRSKLEVDGHQLTTRVDTEVIAHLLEDQLFLEEQPPQLVAAAVHRALAQLEGTWAIAIAVEGRKELVLARRRCPLIIARTLTGYIAASDRSALGNKVVDTWLLADGDVVIACATGLHWYASDGRAKIPEKLPRVVVPPKVDLVEWPDHTLREISEQPLVIAQLLDRLLPSVPSGRLFTRLELPPFERVRFIACGSSLNASAAAARVFRAVGGIPTQMVVASDHLESAYEPSCLTIAVSQSGETADVLAALESYREPWLAVTNVTHSTIARDAAAVVELGVGTEVGVAATKTFTAQVVALTCIALAALVANGRCSRQHAADLVGVLVGLPTRLVETSLAVVEALPPIISTVALAEGVVYVSRGAGVPYAQEGALKLKELSYQWTECLTAGEFKHGPLALIQQGIPVIAIDAEPVSMLRANLSTMASRGAQVFRVGNVGKLGLPAALPVHPAPWGPIESVVALQHLARSAALFRRHDVDRPRNLAKSVTVQ